MGEENSEKSALVPQLRFPEFREAEGWEATTIGAIGSFYYGKSAPKWSLEENAPTKCVRYGELYTKFGAIISETYSRTNIDPKNLRFSKGGEILVPRVGEKPEDFGRCCCYLPLGNIAIGEMISVFETEQNPLFYTHYFRNLYRQFAEVVEGQNVKNLYYVELEPLPICRPALAEQQKIADCLSSLDELIAAETQKLDVLKAHKKGRMQQLFPREGENVPRLRFPEFREAREWRSAMLQELVTTVSPPSKIQSSGYLAQGKFQIIDQSQESICGWTNDESAVVHESLPLIVFGDHTCAIKFVDKPFAQGADGIKILKAKTTISAEFLFHSLSHRPLMIEDYKRHFSILKERVVFYPEIESGEQQKIADCLSSLDDLITAQRQKIDSLKTHKKGLMQQLFPVLGEVLP